MLNEPGKRATRRSVLAEVHRIAADYAGGYREGYARSRALDELADTAADPDLLSQAAAMHALADNWYAITAVDLLLAAGATQELMERYLTDCPPETR